MLYNVTVPSGGGDCEAFAVAAVELVLRAFAEACAGVHLDHPVETDASSEMQPPKQSLREEGEVKVKAR